jgi:hypothetical protein
VPALLFWLLCGIGAAETGDPSLPHIRRLKVTEHAPVIKGRQDKAYSQALEGAFRRGVTMALRDTSWAEARAGDFSSWQGGIFSRTAEFISSYRILSMQEEEGFLTLTVEVAVDRGRLEKAAREASRLSPLIPVRLLVLVDTFPLAGAAGDEDIDAGHIAASAMEKELLRMGVIIVPAPENLPWQDLEGRASAENRRSLATAAAGALGADYVILGHLQRRADKLLVLAAELIDPASEKSLTSAQSPVELQANTAPEEVFSDPAGEVAKLFSRKLSSRQRSGEGGAP